MLPRARSAVRLSVLIAVFASLVYAKWYQAQEQRPRRFASTPVDVDALRSLQERVRSAARSTMPAVVAVENAESAFSDEKDYTRKFQPYCSGVIIAPEGLVLSQFHVSHRRAYRPPEAIRFLEPGHRTSVILSDGRKLTAELLGANQSHDLSLLQILEPGPYPFAPLAPAGNAKLGDWVLKLGHPLGYRPGRAPVVRLGRVLFTRSDFFVTDCVITGGDSGGPFFDLDGRLGLVNNSVVPRAKYSAQISGTDLVSPMSGLTSRFVRQNLSDMQEREIVRFHQQTAQQFDCYSAAKDTLPLPHWTQGEATSEAFQMIAHTARPSVVSMLDENNRDILLGTIVNSAGDVVTVASLLPATPRCRLPDGQLVSAEVVGLDAASDIALLQVPAAGLQPVQWTRNRAPVAGRGDYTARRPAPLLAGSTLTLYGGSVLTS